MKLWRAPMLIGVVWLVPSLLGAQAHQKSAGTRDLSSGTNWAMQAIAALTGGNPVSSVSESGTVTRNIGGDQQQGSVALQSSGVMASQITLSLNRGTLSETRTWQNNTPSGTWTGFDGVQHSMADHNCWTDGVWFFPALSLLADYGDPSLVFADLGQQQYQGGTVEHIQVYRTATGLGQDDLRTLARMSAVDFYIDSQSYLPVAMAYASHADSDFSVSIPVMIVYTAYTAVNGIQVPFQVNKNFNGSPLLQLSISNAALNH